MEEVKGDVQTPTVFDGVFRESSFFRNLVEQKIAYEVEKAKHGQKDIIDNLGKELAQEKLTRLKNEETINYLGKELTQNKLNAIKGDK